MSNTKFGNITLNVDGQEVVIPDRLAEDWREMAINLYLYLADRDKEWVNRFAGVFVTIMQENDYGHWREAATSLYTECLRRCGYGKR